MSPEKDPSSFCSPAISNLEVKVKQQMLKVTKFYTVFSLRKLSLRETEKEKNKLMFRPPKAAHLSAGLLSVFEKPKNNNMKDHKTQDLLVK